MKLLKETIIAIQNVYEEQNDKIQICLSGGIDSHSVLYAATLAGVPFETNTFFYEHKNILFNEQEVARAEEITKQHSVINNKIVIDPVRYYESGEYTKWMKKVNCSSPQLSLHLECMENIQGVPIISGQVPTRYDEAGVQLFKKKIKDWGYGLRVCGSDKKENFFSIAPDSQDPTYYRYMKQRGNGVHQMFFHTEEQIKAALDLYDSSPWSYDKKFEIYQKGGFVIKKDVAKRTGFEEIKKFINNFDLRFRKPWVTDNHDGILISESFLKNNLSYFKEMSKGNFPKDLEFEYV